MSRYEMDMKKLFQGLVEAVSSQALMPENMQEYIQSTCNQKIGKKGCTEIRKIVIDAFKHEMDSCFDEYNQSADLSTTGKELDEAQKLKKEAWRISGDPAHNCVAQRYHAYHEFIEECREQIRVLTLEVQELREDLENAPNEL